MTSHRGALHIGMCAAWALVTLGLSACGGNAAAPTPTSPPAAPSGASPAPSAARPALASPIASPSPIVAAATPTAASTETGGQSYEVQSGDTLGTIAQQFYGDPTQWRRIYDANKDAIGADPDKLKLGTKLTIPPQQ